MWRICFDGIAEINFNWFEFFEFWLNPCTVWGNFKLGFGYHLRLVVVVMAYCFESAATTC